MFKIGFKWRKWKEKWRKHRDQNDVDESEARGHNKTAVDEPEAGGQKTTEDLRRGSLYREAI